MFVEGQICCLFEARRAYLCGKVYGLISFDLQTDYLFTILYDF